jgi:drug/metabolite transporter (DMT)-like permease
LLVAALSLIWGLAFVAVREADFQLSPLSIQLARWLVASAGFAVVLPFLKPKARFEGRDAPRLLAVSLLSVVVYGTALNYSETTLSAGLAGLIVSLGPVFMAVFSVLILKERVGPRLVYALLLAVFGSVLLSVSDLRVAGSPVAGTIEAVLAALVYAGYAVLAKPLIEKYGALPVMTWSALSGTVFLLPLLSPGFVSQMSTLSLDGWASILFLGLISNVIGYTLFYTLVGRGTLSSLSVQLYLVPVVSVVGGILILGEQLTLFTVLGGAATLAAVGLSRVKKA